MNPYVTMVSSIWIKSCYCSSDIIKRLRLRCDNIVEYYVIT